jgi:hypothetical protein
MKRHCGMRSAEPALLHNSSLRLITPLSRCWKIHNAFPSCITRFGVFERVASRIQCFFVRKPNESSCLPCFMRAVIQVCGTTVHNRGCARSSRQAINWDWHRPRVRISRWSAKVCDAFACDLGNARGARLGAGRRQSALGGSLAPIIIKMIRHGNTN